MSAKRDGGWIKWVVLPLVCAAGAGGWWWWHSNRAKESALDYKTASLTRGDVVQSVTANGQINPVKQVQVGSQTSGIIKEILADFNSQVTNGQVIAQIDPSTYQQIIVQSEAELANAQASLELAQVTYERNQALRTNELIAKSEFDKSRADLHQAEAVVKTREALLRKARVDLERTTIYAPIDGVVISRNVDVGQTVAASFNTPTLFLIANDLRKMQIEAMVSEADVGGVEVGQRVNFTVDAFASRQFQGQVKQVRYAPITNQNVVNYTAIVEVDNSDLKLRPGMTANATVVTAQRPAALRMPNAALRFRPPENALVNGTTNAPARGAGPAGQTAPTAALAGSGASEAPAGDRLGGGARPGSEERRRMFENMTPEQREQFRAARRGRSGDEPRLLLADEPTGNLDTRTSIEIMGIFQELNRTGMTILMVTHELDIARYATRTVVMRDGRIVSDRPVTERLQAAAELRRLDAEHQAIQLAP